MAEGVNNFRKALEDSCFALHLKGDGKEAIIGEMIDLLVEAGRLPDREAALRAVLERERKMSTGMQHGVAIPHGKTDTVAHMVTAFGLKQEGADFDAVDRRPSKIFVMTVSPVCEAGPHMRYLAEMGKVLNRPSVRKRLLQARSKEDVIRILTE
ncbi:MAG: PTS sugar transporter subunit IIA [Lentisphaerae bacterium]|nr:PTS sugar transporter subunit IIA [Lentisphaerota bacterium]